MGDRRNQDQLTAGQDCLHRLYRGGICPILEVTAVYPVLTVLGGELSPAAARFNQAYRAVAEGWMAWAEGSLLEQVRRAFSEGGRGAAYRFERCRALCRMTVTLPSDGASALTVYRTLCLRGGGFSPVKSSFSDSWRLSDLTLFRVSGALRDPPS